MYNEYNEQAIKSGWTYEEKKHPVINDFFAHKKTEYGMIIMFKDKTFYNEDEVKLIKKKGGITKNIHLIKNIFDGEVIK